MAPKGKERSFTAATLKVPFSTPDINTNNIDIYNDVPWKFTTDVYATEKDRSALGRRRTRRQTLLTEELQRLLHDTGLQFFKNTSEYI